jgi:hypothetical protein
VVEEGGGLRGYGGGLWRKRGLLEFEQGIIPLFAGTTLQQPHILQNRPRKFLPS